MRAASRVTSNIAEYCACRLKLVFAKIGSHDWSFFFDSTNLLFYSAMFWLYHYFALLFFDSTIFWLYYFFTLLFFDSTSLLLCEVVRISEVFQLIFFDKIHNYLYFLPQRRAAHSENSGYDFFWHPWWACFSMVFLIRLLVAIRYLSPNENEIYGPPSAYPNLQGLMCDQGPRNPSMDILFLWSAVVCSPYIKYPHCLSNIVAIFVHPFCAVPLWSCGVAAIASHTGGKNRRSLTSLSVVCRACLHGGWLRNLHRNSSF